MFEVNYTRKAAKNLARDLRAESGEIDHLGFRNWPSWRRLQMNVQIIENDGRPEWAVIRYEDYLGILERLEDLDDIKAYDQAKDELARGTDEVIPAEIFDRLSSGENPLRVWREYRGLTQRALADAAGVGKSYISQLESGTKTGAVRTLRSLARALNLDVDDLEPWPQA